MTLAQTTQDHYASLLLYEMSPCSSKSKSFSVKLDLQLTTLPCGYAHKCTLLSSQSAIDKLW
jgi:hypothetical protein